MQVEPLKALTLRQPYPFLVLRGDKQIETRSQPMHYRGTLYLHAAATTALWRTGRTAIGDYEIERDRAGLLVRGDRLTWPYRLPLGAIVGTVDVVDCLPILEATDELTAEGPRPCVVRWGDSLTLYRDRSGEGEDIDGQFPYGDYTPGRHALLLANPRRLPVPVPCRGSQARPWTVPDDVAAQVRGQLQEAPTDV
jgi:hypothetical protein